MNIYKSEVLNIPFAAHFSLVRGKAESYSEKNLIGIIKHPQSDLCVSG